MCAIPCVEPTPNTGTPKIACNTIRVFQGRVVPFGFAPAGGIQQGSHRKRRLGGLQGPCGTIAPNPMDVAIVADRTGSMDSADLIAMRDGIKGMLQVMTPAQQYVALGTIGRATVSTTPTSEPAGRLRARVGQARPPVLAAGPVLEQLPHWRRGQQQQRTRQGGQLPDQHVEHWHQPRRSDEGGGDVPARAFRVHPTTWAACRRARLHRPRCSSSRPTASRTSLQTTGGTTSLSMNSDSSPEHATTRTAPGSSTVVLLSRGRSTPRDAQHDRSEPDVDRHLQDDHPTTYTTKTRTLIGGQGACANLARWPRTPRRSPSHQVITIAYNLGGNVTCGDSNVAGTLACHDPRDLQCPGDQLDHARSRPDHATPQRGSRR